MNAMRFPHPNPLMELPSDRLSQQAGESLLVPKGEGATVKGIF